jgi:hypothetical protein
MAAGRRIYDFSLITSFSRVHWSYLVDVAYLDTVPIEQWPSDRSTSELNKIRHRADPRNGRWREVCQLVRAVVLLQHAEAAGEAEAGEEDTKASEGVEPGLCAAVWGGAELGEVVGGRENGFRGLLGVVGGGFFEGLGGC